MREQKLLAEDEGFADRDHRGAKDHIVADFRRLAVAGIAAMHDALARGFAASEDINVAVCVLPGTELAFAHDVKRLPTRLWPWHDGAIRHKTAIFRQINKDKVAAHHDALEFPDGQLVLLTDSNSLKLRIAFHNAVSRFRISVRVIETIPDAG
jgi:hypothetical protein